MSLNYTVQRSTRASQISMSIAAVVLIVLIAAPWWAGRAELRLMVEIFYYLALAQMWSLLAGYGGLVSVGQQAFVGLGGYLLFALAAFGGVHPIMALVLAGVLTALVAMPTALVAFRLQGAYFAIGTWVIAEVFRLGFAQISALGGGSGMSLPASIVKSIAASRAGREHLVYWVALGIAVGAIALVFFLLRSRWGLAMTAIRDSEPASESLGVETYRTKFIVYVVAAGMTGLVGALIFLQKLRISPDAAFSVQDWTALVIFIVVIGGIGTIEGPILGTIIFFILREIAADWGSWYLIVLGGIAVSVMLFAPKGIWGLISARYDIHLFPVGRRLIVNEEDRK
ncbi:branched-chain amino acid ABC transporter permease [Ruegeria sp. MALMAid1280]|uniref:branched-chain amino acid ABC transporter permease n=1 Tax=Ruegeria sp. MALMAid1280 TaxID=3411634 RepID=UPI003BA18F33